MSPLRRRFGGRHACLPSLSEQLFLHTWENKSGECDLLFTYYSPLVHAIIRLLGGLFCLLTIDLVNLNIPVVAAC